MEMLYFLILFILSNIVISFKINCRYCERSPSKLFDTAVTPSTGIDDNGGRHESPSSLTSTPNNPSTVYYEKLKEQIAQINEHNSYIQVKNSIDTIFKLGETKQIPEKYYYSILDACLRRKGDMFALDIFNDMIRLNIPPTSHQLTGLLMILSGKVPYEDCLKMFDSAVAAGLEPTVHNFSPLLKTCGSASRARQILARMQVHNIQGNVISFTAAIKSCEVLGDWKSAIEILELMRAYGIAPNTITFSVIISSAAKGFCSDIAVSVLRDQMTHFPPNDICYGSAITACARCKNWSMVEKLFAEMEALNMPIQESIVISVINCCRSSVKPPKHVLATSDSSEYTRNEWSKAIWIVNRWAGRTDRVTESLITIAMDVCLEAQRYREIIQLYFKYEKIVGGPSKSSLSFAFKACEKIRDPDIALDLLKSAVRKNVCTNALVGSVIVFSTACNRLDVALRAYLAAYEVELRDEASFMPVTNTRRLVKDLLAHIEGQNSSAISSDTFDGTAKIILATARGNKVVLENEDYERFINLLVARRRFEEIRQLLRKSVHISLSRNFADIVHFAVQSLCIHSPLSESTPFVSNLTAALHSLSRSRPANQILLTALSTAYNNVTVCSINAEEGGYYQNKKTRNNLKESLIFNLFREGRAQSSRDVASIPQRAYRIAALACRDGDLTKEMVELYLLTKEDGILDRAVLGHALHVLAKSKDYWNYALEIFGLLRSLGEPPDAYMYTSALVACESGRKYEEALRLLDQMQRDGLSVGTFAVTTAIACCAAAGKTDEALALLALMQERGIPCTAWTFNAAMFACARTKRWKDALTVFEIMRAHTATADFTATAESSSSQQTAQGDDLKEDGSRVSFTEEESRGIMESTINDLSSEHDDSNEGGTSYMDGEYGISIVTYNTLIEALGEGGQDHLLDEVYAHAVKMKILNPLKDFKKRGWVDLHFHSQHMAKAALRYLFEDMVHDPAMLTSYGEVAMDIIIIIGKGSKLSKAIQDQLINDFHPSIRSNISNRNQGRLVLSSKDVGFWLRTHKNLRTANEGDM